MKEGICYHRAVHRSTTGSLPQNSSTCSCYHTACVRTTRAGAVPHPCYHRTVPHACYH